MCECNHLTNFALLMTEGGGDEEALAAATGGAVDRGVVALQIFSYVVVALALLCLVGVAFKVSEDCNSLTPNKEVGSRKKLNLRPNHHSV